MVEFILFAKGFQIFLLKAILQPIKGRLEIIPNFRLLFYVLLMAFILI